MRIYAPHTKVAQERRTRAGRMLAVVGLLIAGAVLGPQALASETAGEPVAVDTYTVAAGETLWAIAASLTPTGEDVRDTMADIVSLNGMTDADLFVGEQIAVPIAS